MNNLHNHNCSFGELKYLGNSIFELTFKNGFTVKPEHMDEIISLYEKQQLKFRLLLLDRSHDYSFSADAVIKIFKQRLFEAVAVFGDKKSHSRFSIENIFGKFYRMKSFQTKNEAIHWLHQCSEKHSSFYASLN